MAQEYKIINETTIDNGGLTEKYIETVSTTAATVTFSGSTFQNITATTITATDYYGNGANLTGISGGSFTGGTVTGATNFTGGLSANTISATTYYNLPTDVWTTGGTYSNGTATFTNNTGGTFNVSGFFTGFTLSDGTNTQSIVNGDTFLVQAGSGLTSTVSATDKVTIDFNITGTTTEASPENGDKLLIWDASTNTHRNIDWNQLPGASGGEVNTASNVGGANGVFYQKSGVDLQFRSLSAGTNITITSGATTLTINSTATGGGSSRITGSTTTSTIGDTNLSQITGLTADSTHFIEAYVTAKSSGTTAWGTWKRSLGVTTAGTTPTIRFTNADMDAFSQNLSATTVNFSVSGINIDINVSGVTSTDIQWNSAYEIITKSTKV